MIKRWQETALREEIGTRRGVHLTGARQCGKTTLAEFVAQNEMRHLTLDDDRILKAAKDDPHSFVDRRDGRTLVIDEIQKAVELLNAIKIRIDHDSSPGQYLITGSSNLRFTKAVKDSLAGRFGRVRLRTLALGEVSGGKGDFLRRAFEHDFPSTSAAFDKRDVIHAAFCGGYPEPMAYGERSRRRWYAEYMQDLLTKDVQDVTEVRKVAALQKVSDWMMAYSSKFFEANGLCKASQLGKETVSSYLAALKAMYVVDEVAPWSGSDYGKLGKRVKYFAADAGLVANLQGWDEDRVYYDDDKCGKLVETWVYHELATLLDVDGTYELTQYRDAEKREIDFIVKGPGDALLGIEVKAGAVSQGDFRHLKWFRDNLAKGEFTGVVLYSGNETLSFGPQCYAVPLSALAG